MICMEGNCQNKAKWIQFGEVDPSWFFAVCDEHMGVFPPTKWEPVAPNPSIEPPTE
jgi:hypothetical protein